MVAAKYSVRCLLLFLMGIADIHHRQLVIVTVLVAPFQLTLTPNDSATNLSGTSVLPLTTTPGWSIVTDTPFTVAVALPIVSLTTVSPFVAVTVCAAPFQSTEAPSASKIARIGTIVLNLFRLA